MICKRCERNGGDARGRMFIHLLLLTVLTMDECVCARARVCVMTTDGSLFLMTRIDVIFVLLPALEKAQVDGYQSAEQITELVGCGCEMNAISELLQCVCDVKRAGDREFFRLSDAKTIAWLDCKLRKLMCFMEQHAEESVRALDEPALRLYCINILGEWIGDAWIAWLKRLHNIQEDAALERALNAVPDAYVGGGGGGGGYSSAEKTSAAAKNDQANRAKKMEEGRRKSNIEKNAKAAKGTKSLLSFFGGGGLGTKR